MEKLGADRCRRKGLQRGAMRTGEGNGKVSVIVPVYNTKLQIERCIASIRNQTYPDLEILLVDDGSDDGSELLCDQAAQEDARIKVIHKENGGVSGARNEGLMQASGEYVIFVDSDDWIEENMVSDMMQAAKKYGVPLVIGDYKRAIEDKVKKSKENPEREETTSGTEEVKEAAGREKLLTSAEILTLYLREDEKIRIPHSVWGKLYSRELIGEKRFPLIKRTEELLFSTEIFCEAGQGVYLQNAYYHYCDDREDSLMHGTDCAHTIETEIPLLLEQIKTIECTGFRKQAEFAYFCFGKRLLYFYLAFRDKMLKQEASLVKGYARKNRKRILASLKNEAVKKTDRLRVGLFVRWAEGYYRFVQIHDR